MNHQEAERVLGRLAEGLPDSEPPMDRVLVSGKSAQRRKSRRTMVGAAVATVLVLAGGAAVLQAVAVRDGTHTEVATDVPTPPEGMRLVGMGRVVVAVPDAWPTRPPGCGPPQNLVFVGPFQAPACPSTSPSQITHEPWTTVGFRSVPRDSAAGAVTPGPIDDSAIVPTGLRCIPAAAGTLSCGQTFAIPSQGVAVNVSAGGEDAGARIQAVRDSLQLLPDTYATVPPYAPFVPRPYEPQLEVWLRLVRQLGLQSRLIDGGTATSRDIVISPEPGSVLRVGETVTLTTHAGPDGANCAVPDTSGCPAATDAPQSGTAVELPTSQYVEGVMSLDVGFGGVLSLDDEGCVYLAGRTGNGDITMGGLYAVWPRGFSAAVSPDGVLTLRNAAGQEAAHGGDSLSLGGYIASQAPDGTSNPTCIPVDAAVGVVQDYVKVRGGA
ncbi:MAG: hypothetical protein JWO11_3204 [Nocardioides sp.]|nr:hypothetical protein [Nocardioides sp.]